MAAITLYGSPLSPNVRTARMAFLERSVPFTFAEIAPDHLGTDEYARINPFRRMPSMVVDGLGIYETPALLSYAEAVGSGPSLEPTEALARARMWQFIGIAQHHLYPVGAMQLFFHAVLAERIGLTPDSEAIVAATGPTGRHLDVLEAALTAPYLTGAALSHADLYCGAMVDYVARAKQAQALLATRPRVAAWLAGLRNRPSFQQTLAPLLAG